LITNVVNQTGRLSPTAMIVDAISPAKQSLFSSSAASTGKLPSLNSTFSSDSLQSLHAVSVADSPYRKPKFHQTKLLTDVSVSSGGYMSPRSLSKDSTKQIQMSRFTVHRSSVSSLPQEEMSLSSTFHHGISDSLMQLLQDNTLMEQLMPFERKMIRKAVEETKELEISMTVFDQLHPVAASTLQNPANTFDESNPQHNIIDNFLFPKSNTSKSCSFASPTCENDTEMQNQQTQIQAHRRWLAIRQHIRDVTNAEVIKALDGTHKLHLPHHVRRKVQQLTSQQSQHRRSQSNITGSQLNSNENISSTIASSPMFPHPSGTGLSSESNRSMDIQRSHSIHSNILTPRALASPEIPIGLDATVHHSSSHHEQTCVRTFDNYTISSNPVVFPELSTLSSSMSTPVSVSTSTTASTIPSNIHSQQSMYNNSPVTPVVALVHQNSQLNSQHSLPHVFSNTTSALPPSKQPFMYHASAPSGHPSSLFVSAGKISRKKMLFEFGGASNISTDTPENNLNANNLSESQHVQNK
jgi:hypothetical protein